MNMPRHSRFLMFFVTTLAGFAGLLAVFPLVEAYVGAFDLGALVFVLAALRDWGSDDTDRLRARARRDDAGRQLILVLTIAALVAVVLALGLVLGARADVHRVDAAVVIGTLALAWAFMNLVYALHYAHLYYSTPGKPVLTFPGGADPVWSDFCYFSFVLGMTFQVSDVVINTRTLRRVSLVHAMVAFVFNIGILALTINVLAGAL
ncbi:MAG: DUF1345 domain-containing protein [Rhodobacteraceae bacterium]|nr:DUF1345 domain-containing protein [Paracoccaceae bacterium]